jgi:serine protease Do
MKKNALLIITAILSGFIGAYFFTISGIFPQKQTVYIQNSDNFSTLNKMSAIGSQGIQQLPTDFVKASELSKNSVVFIKTASLQTYYDWFFNFGTNTVTGSGSGVIFASNGYIVTNNHVIDKAQNIEVIYNKRSYEAKLIGTDPSTDIAVLKIDINNLPSIKMGSAKNLNVGEWVLAVGNPFNLTSTVTAGIVSAKGRNINIVNSQFPIESFIQTDAAINPGNSGGALVNSNGELVGINTAILSRTGSYTGYGFAVPIEIVTKVVKDLIDYGQVQKAFWGGEIKDIDTQLAEQFYKNEDVKGVWINTILSGSSAEKSGINKGDIVLKVNDIEVNSKAEFDEQIAYLSPGNKVKFTIKADGKIKDYTLQLTNENGETGIFKKEVLRSTKLGADLMQVSKVEKDKLKIDSGIKVIKGNRSLLTRMGVADGFIITAINQKKINSIEELESIIDKVKGYVTIEGVSENGQKGYYTTYVR